MSITQENNHEEDHGHHHKETFITKYIFSQDHKMIGKQYLLTAIFMGAIGITLSALFRMKLGWPDTQFSILETILGSDAAPDGMLDSNWYRQKIFRYSRNLFKKGRICSNSKQK